MRYIFMFPYQWNPSRFSLQCSFQVMFYRSLSIYIIWLASHNIDIFFLSPSIMGDPLLSRTAFHRAMSYKYSWACSIPRRCSENGGLARLGFACGRFFTDKICNMCVEAKFISAALFVILFGCIRVFLSFQNDITGLGTNRRVLCFQRTACNFAGLCAWRILSLN